MSIHHHSSPLIHTSAVSMPSNMSSLAPNGSEQVRSLYRPGKFQIIAPEAEGMSEDEARKRREQLNRRPSYSYVTNNIFDRTAVFFA
ncbi:hypothetical protein L596_018013 [Steinernema carpocapsae]|uniref:KID domain-containing protein n=1 Tax=Steinernema carpocapsae TaxID=34508 RepID=A0A4U5N449_STECR|nr:hypothetical protein L596_018013 [Steinernema carpocapsae]